MEEQNADKLRVGVFGVGSLGQWHARIYSELPAVELVGVYDVDTARASEVAERYGARAFESLEELGTAVEACSIVVPTDKHFEVFQHLVEQGVHMLVEKPISATTAEAEEMVKIADSHSVILQVGHVERFNPVMQYLEERLTTPRFIEATRLAPYPPPREGGLPRGTEVSVVLDLMIHDLEIILHLVGSDVREIRAVGVPVLSPTEDIANVRLIFENGCVANVTASRISQERMRKIRVFQEDAYLSLDYMEQSGQMHRRGPDGISVKEVPIEKGEPLALELEAFTNCIRARRDPVVSGRHGSAALRLAVTICETIRNRPS